MDGLTVANLKKEDLPAATRVYRLAFGTQFQLSDPMVFAGDSDVPMARFRANPGGARGAWRQGELVGSCFGSLWGSLGIIGPLTVTPELWGKGIAQALLAPTIAWLESLGVRHMALATIPTSPGHLMLYRKFGFHPRFLYAVMLNSARMPVEPSGSGRFSRFSNLCPSGREAALDSCRAFCGELLRGLDFRIEIESVFNQGIGDTLFLKGSGGVEGFGICHIGPGSESESGTCYLKAGAVRPGKGAGQRFGRLLDTVRAFSAANGMNRLRAGVNYARVEALEAMFEQGFFIERTGVAMHRYNHEGYNRPGVYMVDDWR